ncbi:hypothetical protein [Phenylobacterium sp.]|uniref:hypothetical protein n=1 Tax=Phenylobacterium sp. TaxID=1871053 RepID=UPI00120DA70E|nr:hypothetical protein [Phenylobacterium sp.]THD64575.1 MAG: hypothetical protein E8A12_08035 [Phenylobacterium sp.]
MNSHRNCAAVTGRAMATGLALAIVAWTAPQAALGAGKAPSIDGVWEITNVTVTGANPMTTPSPEASLYTFSHGHYVYVADTSRTPRTAATPAKDPANPTDAEKLAKYQEWGPVIAQGGAYTVKGATLTRVASVAKNVAAIGPGGQSESEFKLTGGTLVLITKSPAGQPAREQRLTLARVK